MTLEISCSNDQAHEEPQTRIVPTPGLAREVLLGQDPVALYMDGLAPDSRRTTRRSGARAAAE